MKFFFFFLKHVDFKIWFSPKFLRAVVKAYNFLKTCVETDNLAPAAEALKPSFSSMSDADLKVSIKQYFGINAWTETPVMTEASLEKLIAVCSGAGMVNGETDYAKIVNTTVAQKVIESLQ